MMKKRRLLKRKNIRNSKNKIKKKVNEIEDLNAYNKTVELESGDAMAWNKKGVELNKLGRYEEALKAYDKAIELKSDYAVAWNNKGAALNKLGRYEEALEILDRAIEIAPDDVVVWNNKGATLNKLGRYEEALKAYDKAIELKPDDIVAWNNKGATLNNLGHYEEALDALDKVIELKPDDSVAWYNKGVALNKLGRCEEALEKEISKKFEDLKNIKKDAKHLRSELQEKERLLNDTKELLEKREETLKEKEELLGIFNSLYTAEKADIKENKKKKIEKLRNFLFNEFIPTIDNMNIIKDEYKRFDELRESFLEWKLSKIRDWDNKNKKVNIAFIGKFSAGKSSIINSIISDRLLPIDVTPATAVPTYLSHGYDTEIVYFENIKEEIRKIDIKTFKNINYINLKKSPISLSFIKYFVVFTGSLNKNINIIDTPGFGANNKIDLDNMLSGLEMSDVILYVVDINDGYLTNDALTVLGSDKINGKNIYIVLNKAETKSPSERKEIKNHLIELCKKENINVKDILFYSAKKDKDGQYREKLLNIFKYVKDTFKQDNSIDRKTIIGEIDKLLEEGFKTLKDESRSLFQKKEDYERIKEIYERIKKKDKRQKEIDKLKYKSIFMRETLIGEHIKETDELKVKYIEDINKLNIKSIEETKQLLEQIEYNLDVLSKLAEKFKKIKWEVKI